ncbi:MAG: LemA family protein [Porphyromonas sp.]|nr:LemA family protein [Porphyromonas sp.]
MKKGVLITIIAIAVIAVWAISYGIKSNNTMVTMEEEVKTAWSQVENQYQRRAELIPNLVATVKGYAAHENETLQGVVNARAKASQTTIDPENITPEAMQQYQAAQGELSQALGRLMVTVERYPDLKANENFQMLQTQLEGTENRIAVERQRYNESTRTFNTYIRKFPRSIVANMLSFDQKPYFEARDGADIAPVVEF